MRMCEKFLSWIPQHGQSHELFMRCVVLYCMNPPIMYDTSTRINQIEYRGTRLTKIKYNKIKRNDELIFLLVEI